MNPLTKLHLRLQRSKELSAASWGSSCSNSIRYQRAFTMIEIMVVVAIIGITLAIGIPSFTRIYQKEGMRKAVSDMLEACKEARAQAILTQKTTELVISAQEGKIEVPGGTDAGGFYKPSIIPDNISIELLGVNFIQYEKEDVPARVRFFPNGTSDEFTIVFRSDKNEWKKISLEVVTGLAELEDIK